jgi:NADPH:quinone reductase-like Zn-dependent oxidoreductase
MRAIWITQTGGPEVLAVRESADPQPGPDEVRVRVRAAGLNFAEVMARQGLYPDAPKPPCVVGYEVAGVVDALGANVAAPAVGRRVIGLVRFGGHADTVCVRANQLVDMPDGMDFVDGAALPVNYITAYHMLSRIAGLRGGDRVLVHLAAGGVGIAVLQLCRTCAPRDARIRSITDSRLRDGGTPAHRRRRRRPGSRPARRSGTGRKGSACCVRRGD